ncbi:MAG: vWA domain-containing protein [Pseudomonadota bacterium]
MLIRFFLALRVAGLKPSVGEFLQLLAGLRAGLADGTPDGFHALARTALVKDETQFDLFDRVFGAWFAGAEALATDATTGIPQDWLRQQAELLLDDEDKARITTLGGWEALMQALRERIAEQQGRHEGGNRWIGTAGTSPFGNAGYNPEGVRIGGAGGQRRAVKMWQRREDRNLAEHAPLDARQLALALRKLRRFAREGVPDQLDLSGTIEGTARRGGLLDLRFQAERRNAVKLLLFLDIGGSMDEHVRACESLFSAARSEFRHLEHFYFHNCPYERVWRDNRRRWSEWTPLPEILHKYPADWRVVIVGDASMSPHEILAPGGSVEHFNDEPGAVWMQRLLAVYRRAAWINPVPEDQWEWTPSIALLRELMGGRMFPLTLDGLDRAIARLKTG